MPDLPSVVEATEARTESVSSAYLDFNATTPCDPRVVQAMLPYFSVRFANPSSIHAAGRAVAGDVERSRAAVAEMIGADPSEIVFTSGATESNNLAVRGVAGIAPNGRRRIVTCAVEHKSVLAPCQQLGKEGFDVVVLPVDECGRVKMDAAREAIDGNTLLVTIQAANNEIGTIQDIRPIVELAHGAGAVFHCDAAQACGKIPVDVGDLGVDLLSLSAHKMFGPKGVGALFVVGGPGALPIAPLSVGGGQEGGMRPGTLNVPAIVGFGKACELACVEFLARADSVASTRQHLEEQLTALCPGKAMVLGNRAARLPGTAAVLFRGLSEINAFTPNISFADRPSVSIPSPTPIIRTCA